MGWAGVCSNKFRESQNQCPEFNFHLFTVGGAETVFKSVKYGVKWMGFKCRKIYLIM